MKKIQLLGIALVALCAFSAFTTASAFAALEFELAQWLANGARIATALASDTLGELSFENSEKKAGFLCSGLFEGTVGPESADVLTKLVSLANITIAELDESGATGGIACVSDGKTCESGEIWPLNFPILTELELDKGSSPEEYFDLLLPNEKGLLPAYFLLCLVLGISVDELCEAVSGSGGEVKNVTGGVEPVGKVEPEGTCGGTTGVGLITADPGGLITLTNGEPLTVSE